MRNAMRNTARSLACVVCLLFVSGTASAQTKAQPQLRGYSVILLQGDQQPGTDSDLPPAARAAIADVKDFLPFRSYRLLDSSWTLASDTVHEYSSRLRGVDQDYQVTVGSSVATDGSKVDVRFSLVEARSQTSWTPTLETLKSRTADTTTAFLRSQVTDEESRLEIMQGELVKLREKLNARHPDVLSLQSRIEEAKTRLADLQRKASDANLAVRLEQGTVKRSWIAHPGPAVIDTSFTMRLGETVVVGTSRVGGDKALIALLTAVPASGK